MDEDVERMGRICHGPGCQVVGQYSPPDLMQSTESLTGPWQDFAADLMGSLATSESLLERGSRLLRSVLRGGYDAINNHITLREIFTRFGNPYLLATDNGPQFRGVVS